MNPLKNKKVNELIGQIRKKINSVLEKIGLILALIPLTPNQFTFLAIPLALIACFYLIQENYLMGLIFVLLSVLIDLFDGSFAKAKNKKTFFGNYWDAVTDKIVEAIIYFGFIFSFPMHAFLAFAFTMLNSYAKPRVALVIETDNHDWPAIGERADRLILLIAGLFLTLLISVPGINLIKTTLALISIITLIGLIQRILYAKKLIVKAEKENKILSYLKKK
jgi:archaetidylinositol phosphate synthase